MFSSFHNLLSISYLSKLVSNKKSICSSLALNCNKNNIDLWHFSLGHPGKKVIEQICTNFPYVQSVNNSISDISHYAKHHKLPFPESTTTFAAIFILYMWINGVLGLLCRFMVISIS